MSRCFPYPPPGHLRNGARGEAVSESIKKDWKEAITEHDIRKKKDKREKEKRVKKSRKEKKDACSVATCNQTDKNLLKGKEEEAERSSLTEEHEPPVCSQSLCYSPDSTRSSKKRKGDDSVYNATKTHGNVIRIRLPLQRHIEPIASANGEQSCSTSGKNLSEQEQVITISRREHCSTINFKAAEDITSAPIKPILTADLERKEKSARLSSKTEKKEKKLYKAESRYKALFEDWAPLPVGFAQQNNFDDCDWLCCSKRQERSRDKRLQISHDEPANEGLGFWPCARFLPHADIYALPYTIPF
ncbi:conserved hypothetical protein [Ricinus communis]|uniref:Uncharacterized protein n=1 Tax=Ricinus communis TaxID=3988 RepID=B9R8C6_RICCO|nr:conserved hypothetical protein [Ricinus communis]